jgi:ATP-dependent RNA helicase RhlE
MNIHEQNASARQSQRPFKKNQPDCGQPRSLQPEAASVFSTLLPELKRAVAEEGYTVPTPIQTQSIPHLLAGRDLIGCAQTGTGKTAAFILPILQYLHLHKRQPARGRSRVLILTPTRELAAQINESAATYGRHLRFAHAVIFGGVSQLPQVQA